jgi:Ca-activated chloride channel family protein
MIGTVLLAAVTASPPPVFRASVEKVYVDAFVSRGGQAVRGLRESDFELRDDGVPQAVELVALEQAPLTVVLALDTSGSVAGRMLDALRAAARALVEGLPARDHVGLLTFSHRLDLRAGPQATRAEILGALDHLEATGATALHDAIYAAMRLSSPEDRRLVVVFSDGADNRSWLSADDVREASRRTGAVVYAVCRGPQPAAVVDGPLRAPPPARESGSVRELRLLAESTGGLFLDGADPAGVRARFQRVLEDMSTRYLLAFVPTGRRAGTHRLEVKVRAGKGTVRCRRSYVVAPQLPSAGTK